MAFAGLWGTWTSPEGRVAQSCTIITTEANSFVQPLHNRMPVILSDETQALWLEPLLIPAPADFLTSHPVAETVNSVKNQGPECIVPLLADPYELTEGPPLDGRLFS